jgi:LAO/AO transport system kinase
VLGGDRAILGRALSLVESRAPHHRAAQTELVAALQAVARPAYRIGISGVPGAGKSTFIEAFGLHLTGRGLRVAVLAVDPSSEISGGSILGDKTRMEELSRHPLAFIRPSPSAGFLGGAAASTRDAILVCEAAGFDVVIVETVGVGQSETQVAGIVDFFLVLTIAGAGDELQGIKRGILELADLIAVNKADGDNIPRAREAQSILASAIRLFRSTTEGWVPRVQICSALTHAGIDDIWAAIVEHRTLLETSNRFEARRRQQDVLWMRQLAERLLLESYHLEPAVQSLMGEVETQVEAGTLPPVEAAHRLVTAWQTAIAQRINKSSSPKE